MINNIGYYLTGFGIIYYCCGVPVPVHLTHCNPGSYVAYIECRQFLKSVKCMYNLEKGVILERSACTITKVCVVLQ